MTTPDGDDDKTILSPPSRGASTAASQHDGLPAGTRLSEFEIVSLIGVGGFGIVYLAHDHSLNRRVALKEYMPQSLARRGNGLEVTMRSAEHAETFQAGLRSFVTEARMLAKFDHPALVRVYRFWEANGTAYMVMPYYVGRTLKELSRGASRPPDEAWLRKLMIPILDALDVLHAAKVYHRDVAPDNIILLEDETPVLLDFGAARHVIGDSADAPTVILKPSYAPAEQYMTSPDLRQGAWTDFYALAATIYFVIVGNPPPPSPGRLVKDSFTPLEYQAQGRYGREFLQALDRALSVRPQDRPQCAQEFKALLQARHSAPDADTAVPPSPPAAGRLRPWRQWTAGMTAVIFLAAGIAFWFLRKNPPAAEAPVVSDTPVTQAPASAAMVQAPPAPAVLPPAFDPVAETNRIFLQRNPDHVVTVAVPNPQVVIGRDKLRFNVQSSASGHVYVLMAGTDRKHFYLLFPNQIDRENFVAAGKEMRLPRPGWSMVSSGPAGINHFVVMVSPYPRDFSKAGLIQVDPFAEFQADAAANSGGTGFAEPSVFAGDPVCPAGTPECPRTYGASLFTIEEVLN